MSLQTNDVEERSGRRTLPSFVKKLWIIVNDQQTNQFIWWTTKGKSIWIPDAAAFSKSVLPRHFKHSNWQSFVRQLNLYGFRKVCDSEGLDQTRTNAQDGWQFRHEQFQRNCPHLLQNIKRKRNQNKSAVVAPTTLSAAAAAAAVTTTTAAGAVPTPSPIAHSRPVSWSPTSSFSRSLYHRQQSNAVDGRLSRITDTVLALEKQGARIHHTVTELRNAQQKQHEVMESLLPLIKMLLYHPHCNEIKSSSCSNSRSRVQLHQKIDKLHHQLMDHTNLLDPGPSVAEAAMSAARTATTAISDDGPNNNSTITPYSNTLPPIRTARSELTSSLIPSNSVVLPSIATPTRLPAIHTTSFYHQPNPSSSPTAHPI